MFVLLSFFELDDALPLPALAVSAHPLFSPGCASQVSGFFQYFL